MRSLRVLAQCLALTWRPTVSRCAVHNAAERSRALAPLRRPRARRAYFAGESEDNLGLRDGVAVPVMHRHR